MSDIDAARLGALARAFEVEPRTLLVALMRLARNPQADAAQRRALLDDRIGGASAVALLLTPIADFGHDAVDRAFATIWPPADGG